MREPQVAGARVRSRQGGSGWTVSVDRVATLQQLAVMSVGASRLVSVEVTVGRWRPPIAGWIGEPRLPGIAELSVEPRDAGVRVRLGLTAPTDAARALSAVVRILRPVPRDTGPLLTFTAGLPLDAAALGGIVVDVLPDDDRDAHLRRSDLLVTGPVAGDELPAHASVLAIDHGAWRRDGQSFTVDIDPTVHRPIGRRSTGQTAVVDAVVTGSNVELALEGGHRMIFGDLTPADVLALRPVGALRAAQPLPDRLVRQINACGVVVLGAGDSEPATDLDWQARSVHERRHALRQYGPWSALDAWPTVSVVLVTHRPDHLGHAMRQLAGLRYPRLEVVIGAHGDHVDASHVSQLAQALPFPTTVVAVDGTHNLGEALQRCSDRAEGALLTKMDDDDFYGPEHIWDLVLARQYSGATVAGKALDWIHLESEDATVFRPTYPAEKYADFVAGGTILLSRGDLAAVGGWRPVPKSVDRALLDRVLDAGGLVYRTHGLGYVYVRHSAGHTATVADQHFLTKTAATYPGLIRHEAFGTIDQGDNGGAS